MLFFICELSSFLIIASIEKAKFFRNKFRAKLPIRYSARRRSDASTPPTSPTLPSDGNHQYSNNSQNVDTQSNEQPCENQSHNSDGSHQADQTNSLGIPNEVDGNFTPNGTDSIILNDTNLTAHTNSLDTQNETTNVFDENSSNETEADIECSLMHEDEVTDRSTNELKPIMPNVEMEVEEIAAIEAVFDDCDDSTSNSHLAEVNLSPDESMFWDDGVLMVKKKYSTDCEMTYTYGKKLVPKVPLFEIKINDPISMNTPFKENVSF